MIPRMVLVRGRKYKVSRLTRAAAKLGNMEGDCNTDIKRIRVKTKNKDESAHTLFHEVLHAVLHEYEVSLRHEEHVVKNLENGLMQVLRDNPKLVKYLLDK